MAHVIARLRGYSQKRNPLIQRDFFPARGHLHAIRGTAKERTIFEKEAESR